MCIKHGLLFARPAVQVSLAIIDPCPVTPSLQLPPFYEAPVRCASCCSVVAATRKPSAVTNSGASSVAARVP